jgi:hypothetical protein
MPTRDESEQEKRVPSEGIEVEIRLLNKELAPKFEPVIKKVREAVRELTGTNCSEQVAAKLRW